MSNLLTEKEIEDLLEKKEIQRTKMTEKNEGTLIDFTEGMIHALKKILGRI